MECKKCGSKNFIQGVDGIYYCSLCGNPDSYDNIDKRDEFPEFENLNEEDFYALQSCRFYNL